MMNRRSGAPPRGAAPSGGNRSWWSGRWLRALSAWLGPTLLATGRLYVRRDQVKDVNVDVGAVSATVYEPTGGAYHVRIGVTTFPDEVWEKAVRLMSQKVAYAASLANDEIPRDVEDVFRGAGVGLFPERRAEFDAECTCPEWATYCAHVAAVLMLLGDMLDEDPFILFLLRGRTREQLMAELRTSRSMLGAGGEAVGPLGRTSLGGVALEEPLQSCVDRYWSMGKEVEGLQIRVRPPEVDLEVIKLLGVPSFVSEEGLLQRMARVYRAVSQRALDVAYEEFSAPSDEEEGEGLESQSRPEGDHSWK